ncbi:5-hydroxytryptamine receptor 3A-like [Engystomops pustulosus]|uniref:5-hydroxytryptamine receptor 3A-like n=1 Tax=Engystomops pustulosus TaxID=76066 RepID=UPI003AFACF90
MSVQSLLLIVCALGLCHCDNCSYTALEKHLNLDNQSQDIRPVSDWNNITYVFISMTLYTVINLDTNLQSLTSYVWFSMEWKNEFIQWDPNMFCNITHFFYKPNKLWAPDIYIVEMTEADDKNPVIPFYGINNDGLISFGKPIRIASTCNLDVYFFPFDTQHCNITVINYFEEDIQFTPKYNSSYIYKQSKDSFFNIGEWKLLNFSVTNLPNGVRYQVTIKRNASVQVIAFIVPICFLIFLDVIAMFIHLEDTQRLMFKITVVLGFALLLVVLNQVLATSESPPLLSVFCCTCMAIMVASIMGSIATTYMNDLSDTNQEVPGWIHLLVIKFLARVLFFKVPHRHEVKVETIIEDDNSGYTEIGLVSHRARDPLYTENSLEVELLKMLLKEVQNIHKKLIDANEDDEETDWHTVALVVDRLFLIFYLITIFILFVTVFTLWAQN